MKKLLAVFVISFFLISCSSDPSKCRLIEAYSGYPASFENSLENIEYDTRYEFIYDDQGVILQIDEYNLADESLFRSYTDFDTGDDILSNPPENGDVIVSEDDEVYYFLRMKDGNPINEGLQSKTNPEDIFLWATNYFDDQPNVLRRPEFRGLPIGRQGTAAYNAKNNLIGWADLQGSNLFLNYHFAFNSSGLLIQSQVPSGLTFDFTYNCP